MRADILCQYCSALVALSALALLVGCTGLSHPVCSNDFAPESSNQLFYSEFGPCSSASIEHRYQPNYAVKGALIGGAAGALTGVLSSVSPLPTATMGAIIGASYGAYLDRHTTLVDSLYHDQVQVMILGDHVLMVMPSATLFYPFTAMLLPNSCAILNKVARYINHYAKTLVTVSAYTGISTEYAKIDSKTLATQQAERIVRYFTAINMDARLLYAMGQGSRHLVDNQTALWSGDNFRIEITFKRLLT